jgi:tetratricopeptide (TPR) repeat protein
VTGRAVLSLALLLPAVALGAATLEEQAQHAVARGDYVEARTLYERLADGPGGSVEDRVWAARLSSWLRDFDRARRLYLEALAERPDDREILLGLARVETWSNHHDAADRWLDEVARVAPGDPELEAARHQNEYGRAWHPVLRHENDTELRVGFRYEDFDFAAPATMASVRGAWRGYRLNPWVEAQYWDKFGESTPRLGAGVAMRPWPKWSVASELWTAPASDVFAQLEFELGVGRSLPWGFGVGVDYRLMRFSHSRVHVATGTIEYYFPFPVWVSLNYHRAWTTLDSVEAAAPRGPSRSTCDPSRLQFGTCDSQVANDSFSFRYHQQVTRRLRLHLGYAYGTQSFQALSVDGVGRFLAQTVDVGVDVELTDRLTLALGFTREMRDRSGNVHVAQVALSRFF